MYGTIRMHQELTYPGRVSATSLVNPDFAALARSVGAYGEVVSRTDQFPDAFEEAKQSGLPAVLDLQTNPTVLTPTLTVEQARRM